MNKLTPRQQQLIDQHKEERERYGHNGKIWARIAAQRLATANERGQRLKSRRVGICAVTGASYGKGDQIVYHDGKSYIV